jgi:hypothetical protein
MGTFCSAFLLMLQVASSINKKWGLWKKTRARDTLFRKKKINEWQLVHFKDIFTAAVPQETKYQSNSCSPHPSHPHVR